MCLSYARHKEHSNEKQGSFYLHFDQNTQTPSLEVIQIRMIVGRTGACVQNCYLSAQRALFSPLGNFGHEIWCSKLQLRVWLLRIVDRRLFGVALVRDSGKTTGFSRLFTVNWPWINIMSGSWRRDFWIWLSHPLLTEEDAFERLRGGLFLLSNGNLDGGQKLCFSIVLKEGEICPEMLVIYSDCSKHCSTLKNSGSLFCLYLPITNK